MSPTTAAVLTIIEVVKLQNSVEVAKLVVRITVNGVTYSIEGVKMLKFKPEVRFANNQQALSAILQVAESTFRMYGSTALVTSLGEGTHGKNSRHGVGQAVDFRSKHVDNSENKHAIIAILKECMPFCDVILENEGQDNEHVHVEYDPEHNSVVG